MLALPIPGLRLLGQLLVHGLRVWTRLLARCLKVLARLLLLGLELWEQLVQSLKPRVLQVHGLHQQLHRAMLHHGLLCLRQSQHRELQHLQQMRHFEPLHQRQSQRHALQCLRQSQHRALQCLQQQQQRRQRHGAGLTLPRLLVVAAMLQWWSLAEAASKLGRGPWWQQAHVACGLQLRFWWWRLQLWRARQHRWLAVDAGPEAYGAQAASQTLPGKTAWGRTCAERGSQQSLPTKP
mmetsp:Transcript_7638/g.18545  ORF Transcript_7638/g.18545 Transcript_7638/m.18545 type:complete len:237 (+) Transcript_7638:2106-2816(+)